ncbi:hypothetical protein QZL74_14405 [Burkholderia gladioli pv. alliicola]|uniref:hypothetical protein n=1 Tax=Burkholderia gladioli TaxID=28095 RepID=UPI003D816276
MTTTNENSKPADGGPAFPHPDYLHTGDAGMSMRAYAAIKLRVPDSGIGWLDQMIVTSMRDEFAAKAMQGLLSNVNGTGAEILKMADGLAEAAYALGGSMLKARG